MRGVPVLAYHGITTTRDASLTNLRRLHIWEARFEEHLHVLRSRWRPMSLSALCEATESRRTVPSRSVVVTLDDGYRNVLTTAVPLLKQFAVPATIFVLTGVESGRRLWIDRLEAVIAASSAPSLEWDERTFSLTSDSGKAEAIRALVPVFARLRSQRESALERLRMLLGNPPDHRDPDRDLLTWDEVRTIRDTGLEIGSHAHLHEPLTQLSVEEAGSSLLASYKTLERELGRGRYALSYPYGAWNDSVAEAAREAGKLANQLGVRLHA